jgi:hypothetical protein
MLMNVLAYCSLPVDADVFPRAAGGAAARELGTYLGVQILSTELSKYFIERAVYVQNNECARACWENSF